MSENRLQGNKLFSCVYIYDYSLLILKSSTLFIENNFLTYLCIPENCKKVRLPFIKFCYR